MEIVKFSGPVAWRNHQLKYTIIIFKTNIYSSVVGISHFAMLTSSNGTIFRVTGPFCGEFPTQRPVTRSFDVFFDLPLNKRLSKQPWGWWFETPPWSLWRHCNAHKLHVYIVVYMWVYFFPKTLQIISDATSLVIQSLLYNLCFGSSDQIPCWLPVFSALGTLWSTIHHNSSFYEITHPKYPKYLTPFKIASRNLKFSTGFLSNMHAIFDEFT